MKFFRVLFILLFFQSCEERESVRFTEPQPSGIENAEGFNKNYQGEYWCPDDSTYLTVTSSHLIRHANGNWVFHRTELDSSLRRQSDETIRKTLLKDGIRSFFKNDSLFCTWEQKDTMFYLSDETLIRYFKGAYFLNTKRKDDTWKVSRLDLHKGKLSLSYIYPHDSLFTAIPIDSITEIKNDSGQVINYIIKPNKKELKKLVKGNAFKQVTYWVKIEGGLPK